MKRRLLIFILTIGTGVGGAAYFLFPLSSSQKETAPSSNVISVKRGTLETRVSETGRLQPSRTVDIKSQFSGEVNQIYVTNGERVRQGQLLAVLTQAPGQARQVAQLRAGIDEEGINVEKARLALARMRSLFDKGFIPRKELESAEQDHRRALVRLDLAKRQLLLALGGNQELYQRSLRQSPSLTHREEFEIRAPASGTILDILAQAGEMITSGTATVGGGTILMKLADLRQMVVKSKINEVNIARVKMGQSVDIQLDALPSRTFQGSVTAISTQGVKEDNIVTYEVTIEIRDPEGQLRPMLTANVDIVTEKLKDVLTVPLEALHSQKGEDFVNVMEQGKPVTRHVRVALRTAAKAVIVKGLHEGDQVVLPSYEEGPASSRS